MANIYPSSSASKYLTKPQADLLYAPISLNLTKFNVSGGTMTGPLNVANTLTVNNSCQAFAFKFSNTAGTPTVQVLANAGIGASASIESWSTGSIGRVQVNTGTSPTNGDVVHVTLASGDTIPSNSFVWIALESITAPQTTAQKFNTSIVSSTEFIISIVHNIRASYTFKLNYWITSCV